MTAAARLDQLYDKAGACRKCGWLKAWQVRRFVNDGGQVTYPLVCHCGNRARIMVPKELVVALELETPELARQWLMPKCDVCSTEGAQQHHWAPWAIFGDEADRWPQSFLCQACHDRWHQLVTPQLR